MGIKFPKSRKEVADRAKADVNSSLPTANAFLKNSYLGALITGYAGRVYEFYLQLKNALLEMFPDTATGVYLERWGSYVNVNRLAPTAATGYVVFTGNPGGTIPAGTSLSSSDGQTYITQSTVSIFTGTFSPVSITRTGTTVTVTAGVAHNLATGVSVLITGALQAEYNGTFDVVVTTPFEFTYQISGSPVSPATGSIMVYYDTNYVLVESSDTGSSTNQEPGTELTLNVVIPNVDSTAYITQDGITSGTDTESDVAYRKRVLDRYQNPIALFNENAIRQQAMRVNGVTRVFVVGPDDSDGQVLSVSSLVRSGNVATATVPGAYLLEDGQAIYISGATPAEYNGYHKVIRLSDTTVAFAVPSGLTSPATGTITFTKAVPPGRVYVYAMRDGDSDPYPSPSAILTIRDAVQAIRPAHVSYNDVYVNTPARHNVPFTFTALTPNTISMREAIASALKYTIQQNGSVGGTIPEAAYISAIWQAVSSSGEVVESFTLATPTGDIVSSEGYLPILSNITWP